MSSYLHQNPRILFLIVVAVLFSGIGSFMLLPRLEDPVLRKRVAVITTLFPGNDPQSIESRVTIPLEQSLEQIGEIKRLRSNTRKDICNVVVELKDEVNDVNVVWREVENRLRLLETELPDGCSAPQLEIFPLKAYAAILAIVARGNDDESALQTRRLVGHLKEMILSLNGTEAVRIFGDPGEEIEILVKPEIFAATGLTTAGIASQIREQASYSGGRILLDDASLSIDVHDDSRLNELLGNTLIRYRPDSEPVSLSEISEITRRPAKVQDSIALVDDRGAMVVGAMVGETIRVDSWTRELEQSISEFQAKFPGEYQVDRIFLQSSHVNSRMSSLAQNLMVTGAAVVAVVFLMLGWRCMLVVAMSLPLSVLTVICGMRILAIPIHQMSVTGLIVALGLLIDNAIVMVEEVRSRIYAGHHVTEAMVEAVHHLRLPLFGSTLTTILAFLPIALLPGPSGEFVGAIAISVILAISASFVFSATLVPALVGFVGVDRQKRGLLDYGVRVEVLTRFYHWSLRTMFRAPLFGILVGVVLPITGFYFLQHLPRQFFPATDRNQIQVEVELAAASSVAATAQCVDAVRQIADKDRRIQRQYWFVGESAPTFYYNVVPSRKNVPSYAQAFFDIEPEQDVARLVDELQLELDASIHNARIVVRELQQGPPFDAPLEVRIYGDELEPLQQSGIAVRKSMATLSNVTHTRSDLEDSLPQMDFQLDRSVAQHAGLDRQKIARFLYVSSEGASAGDLLYEGQELNIRVRVDFSGYDPVELISSLPVAMAAQRSPRRKDISGDGIKAASRNGPRFFTVGSLGEFELAADVAAIIRIDGRRVNEVKGYLRPGVLPSQTLSELKNALDESGFQLPPGYDLEFGGESEQRSHAVTALMATAVTLFSIMVLSLVAVLGSFRNMLIIAVVGGLSVGLGALALGVTGYPLGFMAIVGTMGLVGIAINDSIVVLAAIRTNQQLPAGEQRELADVVNGCTRHILATSLTTMIGFFPLIVYGGKFWPPLAVVIAGGVGGATILALYLVPSMHCLLWRRPRSDQSSDQHLQSKQVQNPDLLP